MRISSDRIRADIEAIARCTATPGNGATRPTFSPAWAEAREYVLSELRTMNCQIRTDAAGNLHARPRLLAWQTPAWLCGSHIDSVPNGGDYDGVAGVVVALELLRSAYDAAQTVPLELIIFAEEEGPTFGLGMIGSRAWVGDLSADDLSKLRNAAGQTYLEAGKPFGVDAARFVAATPASLLSLVERQSDAGVAATFDRSHYLGLVEVHIEQGPGMWQRDQRLAIVRAIAGRRQYAVQLHGQANHAGATSMQDRHDALAALAEISVSLEKSVQDLRTAVLTIGRVVVEPNAINVIPSRVEFSVDFRAEMRWALECGDQMIRQKINEICSRRGLQSDVEQTESINAAPMSERLCEQLARFGNIPTTVSGALHDSAVMAPHLPTAMLFVPSRDGISHNSDEFSRIEDIAAAAALIERFIRTPTMTTVNQWTEHEFVSVCGPAFEHSPWVAHEAFESRPFSSLGHLHETMCGIVASWPLEKQLDLINAHPDLVGRLAREGKLTAPSTSEQAAAGLTSLTTDEVIAFENYNKLYRNRFGFPFVICARQNRKEAILAAFPIRLRNDRETETATALNEIYKIAKLRLEDAIWES